MDVRGDSGSGGAPQVHAEIKTVGRVSGAQCGLTTNGKAHQFSGRRFGSRVQVGDVFVRHDQEMTARVRVKIKDNVVVFGAVKDEVEFVVGRIGSGQITEDARLVFRFLAASARDVVVSPRTP